MPTDAPGDPCRGGLDRVPSQMRVSGGRLNLGMAEQLPDHREALAQGQRPRRIRMPDVVDAHVVEPGPHAYGLPRPVDVGHVRARLGSRNDPGIAGLARQRLQEADRRRRQVDRAGASLPVGEVNLGRIEIDMLPAQGQDFVSAAARQHQQADRRDCAGG